jgi:hypothetical protein
MWWAILITAVLEAGTLQSTYALISEPLPKICGWHKQRLIWQNGSPYLYLRTTTEGRVIVGGEDEDFVNAHSWQTEFRRAHLSIWSLIHECFDAGTVKPGHVLRRVRLRLRDQEPLRRVMSAMIFNTRVAVRAPQRGTQTFVGGEGGDLGNVG